MGNHCQTSFFKELELEITSRQTKIVSNAPHRKYALRMKNVFPPLPPHVQQVRKRLKIPQLQEIIKDCPIYFIHQKSALYQGHWNQGYPHGYGRILFKDFSFYEGLIVQGQPNTFINLNHHEDSFYIFADGSYYRGEFRNAKFQGKGVLITKSNSIKIAGDFQDGLPHGKVTETFLDFNEHYEGEFVKGQKSGKGKYYVDDFLVYEGDFLNGNMHGEGRMIDYNGGEFVGRFQNGKKVVGRLRSINGYVRGQYNTKDQRGEGFFEWQDGKFYMGEFKRNKFDGSGRLYFPHGRVVQGVWQKGHNKVVNKIYMKSAEEVEKIKMDYKKLSVGLDFNQDQANEGTEKWSEKNDGESESSNVKASKLARLIG